MSHSRITDPKLWRKRAEEARRIAELLAYPSARTNMPGSPRRMRKWPSAPNKAAGRARPIHGAAPRIEAGRCSARALRSGARELPEGRRKPGLMALPFLSAPRSEGPDGNPGKNVASVLNENIAKTKSCRGGPCDPRFNHVARWRTRQ